MNIKKEIVAFYNVENFFPPHTTYLPHWDNYKYHNKLHKTAHIFELIKQYNNTLPMLVGLAEIGNKTVLEDLLAKPVFGGNYHYLHYESPDERGIDVALLYDKNKITVKHSEPIRFKFEMKNEQGELYEDTTRDVLHSVLEYNGATFHCFVMHLPSKREQDINLPKRNEILEKINTLIENIIIKDKEAVLVLGDFNENPNEDNLIQFTYHEGILELLHNPFSALYYLGDYSTYHKKEGLLFDQIMFSRDFFQTSFGLTYKKAEIFNPTEIKNWDKMKNRPFRTYSGTRYLGGYSDHFPVLVEFESLAKG
ncbi:endonuclease/exonuclease/phosphatase family protein [Riemerella anatipestifer]|uniref:endonuclease/exonuclease/phosphatase family protein n=1 Tax=Riemerella anatipestifer TaxID=34085 RepID=UPI0012AD8D3C|nr:endonuclease/exonuclease/phosphatase family protein [Riemerella anatipestifer]USL95048.1 endonuclease/exonuclease/phosphatase family protein [Riemerella anatipestifer]